MQQKIALYEEVLTLEPGSRLFFPLAEMYLGENLLQKAEETLRRGLSVHPDHLEAKLLLLDVLQRRGRKDEMTRVAAPLVRALQGSSALWAAWSALAPGKGDDEAVLLQMVGHVLSGKRFSWAGIMAAGIEGMCAGQQEFRMKETAGVEVMVVDTAATGGGSEERDFEEDPDAEEINLSELEDAVKTRTLADLLAYQEEFEQAMLIYEQLRDEAATSADRELFQTRVDEMRMKLEQDTVPAADSAPLEGAGGEAGGGQESADPRVIDTLAALADRLEQRGGDENKTTKTD